MCFDRLPSHISKMVVSTVNLGGPTWMVGSAIFEMWLVALCNAQVTRGLHNGGLAVQHPSNEG